MQHQVSFLVCGCLVQAIFHLWDTDLKERGINKCNTALMSFFIGDLLLMLFESESLIFDLEQHFPIMQIHIT